MTAADFTPVRKIKVKKNYEMVAWSWMRYSGFLLIILAFGHVIIQDVLVGPHRMDLDYVAARWANLGWRVFDFLLLAFAFAHGMNGLRQVMFEYVQNLRWRKIIAWGILVVWIIVSLIGAVAIIGGVRQAA